MSHYRSKFDCCSFFFLPLFFHPVHTDQRPILQAFFIGRALAEIVNERAGAAFENFLAEVGKTTAELAKSLEQLPAQVVARAEKEMSESLQQGGNQSSLVSSSGGRTNKLSSSNKRSNNGSPELNRDINQAVDDLRAEVAAARASARLALQAVKDKKQQQR
jgi:hypothetical protein